MSPFFYITIKIAKTVQRKYPQQNERGGENKRKFTGDKTTDLHLDDRKFSKLFDSSMAYDLPWPRFIRSVIKCFIDYLCGYLYFAFDIVLT